MGPLEEYAARKFLSQKKIRVRTLLAVVPGKIVTPIRESSKDLSCPLVQHLTITQTTRTALRSTIVLHLREAKGIFLAVQKTRSR